MQIPYRKPGKFSQIPADPKMSPEKYAELKSKLAHLKKIQPGAAAEVSRLAELGDFSENAEYQLAKGRLRGINNSILRLEHEVHQADVIVADDDTTVIRLGHTVTVTVEGKEKKFTILGASEAKPSDGKISYHSPIGSALMGREIGDEVVVELPGRGVKYKIIKIESTTN